MFLLACHLNTVILVLHSTVYNCLNKLIWWKMEEHVSQNFTVCKYCMWSKLTNITVVTSAILIFIIVFVCFLLNLIRYLLYCLQSIVNLRKTLSFGSFWWLLVLCQTDKQKLTWYLSNKIINAFANWNEMKLIFM